MLGKMLNIETGEWEGDDAGIGTGVDSAYEYLWKAYLLFGEREYKTMFDRVHQLCSLR